MLKGECGICVRCSFLTKRRERRAKCKVRFTLGSSGHLSVSKLCLASPFFSGGTCLQSPGSDFLLLTFMKIQQFVIFLLTFMFVSAFICRWFFWVLADDNFITELNFCVRVFQERKCCCQRPLCKKAWATLQPFLFLSWHHFCLRKKASDSSGRYSTAFSLQVHVHRTRSRGSSEGSVCAGRLRLLTLGYRD